MADEEEIEVPNLVENWQLDRSMRYLHEEVRPERQWAMVVDLNRCNGCQACAMACKTSWTFSRGQEHMWWANVETKPFGGYPQHWDVRTLELLDAAETTKIFDRDRGSYKRVLDPATRETGRTVFEAAQYAPRRAERVAGYLPSDDDWRYPNAYEEVSAPATSGEEGWSFPLPRLCNHCTYPACLAACPRNNIYKRQTDDEGEPLDGLVLIDQARCRGYRKCVEACPYKKVIYRGNTRKSEGCHGCYPRIEQGWVPLCVSACPERAMLQGWLGSPGSANPVEHLVREARVALPLYPQFGTEPNVYYVPPRSVPVPFLAQMFSNYDQDEIVATLNRLESPSPKTRAALALFGVTARLVDRFELDGESVEAFSEDGERILAVPL